MRRSLLRLAGLALTLALTGCQTWYNDIPSPDDLMHAIPWFDSMIQQRSVHPYGRSDVPRNTVEGTVPVTGSEGDWSAEWNMANTATADRLVNPIAGRGPSATGDTTFHTFCAPCHGNAGAGDGLVGKRVAAPSLLTERARGYTDGYLYSIVRYGRGVMPRYGDKVPAHLRWEVVNFVRDLQARSPVMPLPGAAPAPAAAPPATPGGKN
jgi:mono/diheme cytochrome c family protein